MWDERYSTEDYLFGTDPAEFLKAHAGLLSTGSRALVVADGEGRNSVFVAEQGLQTTAFDASAVAVEKARALAEARNVSVDFHVSDVEAWSWEPEAYDVVVAIFIQFLGPTEMTRAFRSMRSALRPGGLLLLHGYRPEQLEYGTGGPPLAENLYTEDLLRGAFGDFAIERLASYDAEIREGSGHLGMSALIDLVARKP